MLLNYIFKKRILKDIHGNKSVIVLRGSSIHSSLFEGNNLIYNKSHLSKCYFGRGTYLNSFSSLNNTKLGAFSSLSSNIKIIGSNHPHDKVSTFPGFYSVNHKDLVTFVEISSFNEYPKRNNSSIYFTNIGNDVLIYSNVLIVEGISIGDGAIILPGSLVNKNVEPYSIVGGVPAKHLKYRFSKEIIDVLISFQWWNKSNDWILENSKYFDDPNKFVDLIMNGNLK